VKSQIEAHAAWSGVSAAFAALGRAFLCTDREFRVMHGSYMLDRVFGPGSVAAAEGRLLEELFGPELFGAGGVLRAALAHDERREGWRAFLTIGAGRHLVSLTAAPFPTDPNVPCDPRVRYVLVIRPAAQDRDDSLGAPTVMGGLIARSPSMLRIFTLVENLRHTEATVLITGESGTGKELVARALHDQSPRSRGPFVAVNCGALPPELLESEMFGHTRGAFTGAVRDRVGRFEAASQGTLFLDEVGDLPLPLQVKLLRVLQDGTFERVGENQTRTSHARVIAATHVDVQRAVREGRFRSDLYFRLRVVPIDMPPLRQRREDIEPLAVALLARTCARHGRAVRFSPDALRSLMIHDWPGNVRELENAIEFGVAVCDGQTIMPEHLPDLAALDPVVCTGPQAADAAPVGDPPAAFTVAPAGCSSLRRALDTHRWRRVETAAALGISRITLWRRMRDAGLL
jgi:DNA-binding NtrC family response regulator